jgi:hypothetical protein
MNWSLSAFVPKSTKSIEVEVVSIKGPTAVLRSLDDRPLKNAMTSQSRDRLLDLRYRPTHAACYRSVAIRRCGLA